MQYRSKDVELLGHKFKVRKLPPEVGSFIFMRMMGVSLRAAAAEPQKPAKQNDDQAPAPVEDEPPTKITGEMRVRALSFAVFSGAISFEDFKFIQTNCMQAAAIVVERQGVEFPMPLVSDAGVWTSDGEEVANNVGLTMQLTTAVLIHCFADFFDSGGPGL
jgi:hypothetical protein